jgi:hypothetical protein
VATAAESQRSRSMSRTGSRGSCSAARAATLSKGVISTSRRT